MEEMITLRKPDDMHIHLRQGEMLETQVKLASKYFSRAIVMPNTIPAINSEKQLIDYKNEISNYAQNFTPLMTFKITDKMNEQQIKKLKQAGAIAGKYYPKGVTTNSEDGITNVESLFPVLQLMEENDLVLCLHGEMPGVFCLDKERKFIPVLYDIVKRFPKLKIIFEHVSTKEGVNAVLDLPETVAATVTVHHLLFTIDDLLGNNLNPHFFCKPLINLPEDRKAIQEVVFDSNTKFFFGSDNAPHLQNAKESQGSAGIFSLPVVLSLLAEAFEKNADFTIMEKFTSQYGAQFYNLSLNSEIIKLEKDSWTVPSIIEGIVPLCADQKLNWKVVL